MKKRILCLLAAVVLMMCLASCGSDGGREEGKLRIIASSFPGYDLARAAAGDLAEVSLLLPPGTESHSYEPTPRDILNVQNCDLFIYLGGESDAWVDTILKSLDTPVKTLKMMDCVTTLAEEPLEGMEEVHDDHDHGKGQVVEVDEHVWTDPANAVKITERIAAELTAMDAVNGTTYTANAAAYVAELQKLDGEIRAFLATVSDPVMVFGDRFPLRYFAEAYDITCYAAFPGCSTQTEPSAATIAYLTDLVREKRLTTVYYIEFSNHLVADSIAEATGAKTALFHSCHNVTRQELESGVTYLSLMRGNLDTLKETMK